MVRFRLHGRWFEWPTGKLKAFAEIYKLHSALQGGRGRMGVASLAPLLIDFAFSTKWDDAGSVKRWCFEIGYLFSDIFRLALCNSRFRGAAASSAGGSISSKFRMFVLLILHLREIRPLQTAAPRFEKDRKETPREQLLKFTFANVCFFERLGVQIFMQVSLNYLVSTNCWVFISDFDFATFWRQFTMYFWMAFLFSRRYEVDFRCNKPVKMFAIWAGICLIFDGLLNAFWQRLFSISNTLGFLSRTPLFILKETRRWPEGSTASCIPLVPHSFPAN